MKTRIPTLAALLAASFATSLACADPKAFEGLNVGVDLKLVSNSIAVNNWVNAVFADGIGTLDGSGGNEQIPDVTAGYTFPIGGSGLLGLGGSYDLTKSKLLLDPNGEFLAMPHEAVQQKTHYSFYLEPGVLVGGSTQLYAKVAYHSFMLHDPNPTPSIMDQKYTGIGFGAGIKATFFDYWALVVEVEQVQYSMKNDLVVNGGDPVANIKVKSTTGLIGIQYTFNEGM